LLNGEKQIVTGEAQVTEDGKIQYGNLPFRTYYLKEIEAPEGYVLLDEVIEIELDKDNKEISKEEENTRVSKKTDKEVDKKWIDKKIDANKITKENDWAHNFTNLDLTDKNGEGYKYTVEEVKVDGYVTDVKGNVEDGFTITNTMEWTSVEPGKTKVDVEKVWKGKKQDKVTIKLLANGKEVDSIELSKENDWKHTFKDLPVVEDIEDEEVIEYTVEEVGIEGYEV